MATKASVRFNFGDLDNLSPEQLFNLMTAVRLYLADSNGNAAEIRRLTADPAVAESFGQYSGKIYRSRRNAARRAERREAAKAAEAAVKNKMAESLRKEIERLDRLSDSLSNVRGDQIRFMFRKFIAEVRDYLSSDQFLQVIEPVI